MATNQFFPFATGAGALVLTNSQLQAMTALSTGFQEGPADPASVNSVWRQSASIAAMIAQFTADNQPSNVLDDGNIATLEAEFEAALKAYLIGQNIFLNAIPSTTWFVDAINGTDAIGKGLSSGTGAFKTISYAVTYISLFFSPTAVTINCTGAFTSGINVGSTLISSYNFVGSDVSTCSITSTNGDVTQGVCITFANGASGAVQGFTLNGTQGGIVAENAASVSVGSNNFNNCGVNGCMTSTRGSTLTAQSLTVGGTASITVSGTCGSVFNFYSGGFIQCGFTNSGGGTQKASIIFSSATVSNGVANGGAYGSLYFIPSNVTWTGYPTGAKYNISGSLINTSGSGTLWIPGGGGASGSGSAGTTTNGAIYS